MTTHLQRDLGVLRKDILHLGGLVEEALRRATAAFQQRRRDLAERVIENDTTIDELELRVDDDCVKLLALHQPVAGDLRYITAAMKINNDLERIGDLASNMAQRALDLIERPAYDIPVDFHPMAEKVRAMLRDSLGALIKSDPDLAREVCTRDDEIDLMHAEHFHRLEAVMKAHPEMIESAVLHMSVSRNLERIADLATNIAEDVVFLVEAVVIRHPGVQRPTSPIGG